MFLTYSAAEQAVRQTAVALVKMGQSEDWCRLIALDGMDEVFPVFTYTISDGYLHREKWVLPSS